MSTTIKQAQGLEGLFEQMSPSSLHNVSVIYHPDQNVFDTIFEVYYTGLSREELVTVLAEGRGLSQEVIDRMINEAVAEETRFQERRKSEPEETVAFRKTAESVCGYTDALVERVQAGIISASDAQKELNEEAKHWGWTNEQKKYVKDRLQGKAVFSRSAAEDPGRGVSTKPPGEGPPEFPPVSKRPIPRGKAPAGGEEQKRKPIKKKESPEEMGLEVRKARWPGLGENKVPTQLALTYDEPSEQYVMYDLDYGLVSQGGAKEKEIRGQLQAFGVSPNVIDGALKDAKKEIVLIRLAQTELSEEAPSEVVTEAHLRLGVDILGIIESAVQTAISSWGPQATRAQLMMTAMDEVAKATSEEEARMYKEQTKTVLDSELEGVPRNEVPGTKREIKVQVKKFARTYDEKEKRQRIKDFSRHGIPLQEKFEKKPAEDVPPNRLLSTAESQNGFTVGDKVRDQVFPTVTGKVRSFDPDGVVLVELDATPYSEPGAVAQYLPDGIVRVTGEDDIFFWEESAENA